MSTRSPPSAPHDLLAAVAVAPASREDAAEILALQKLAYQSEARLYDDWSLPPLTQSLESLLEEFAGSVILKATAGATPATSTSTSTDTLTDALTDRSIGRSTRLIGSVRARVRHDVCEIGRLIVDPEYQRRGIGSRLLAQIETCFPDVAAFELFTGDRSESNIRLYRRHGYVTTHTQPLSPSVSLVYLRKSNARP